MKSITCALIASVCISSPLFAQDDSEWSREDAVDELAEIIVINRNDPPSRAVLKQRNENIAAWGERVRESELDLGEDSYLLTIIDYMAGRREDASEKMFAYVVENGDFPESATPFSNFISRMLPRRLNIAVENGEWDEFNTVLPVLTKWSEDPYPGLSSLATTLRAKNGDEAREAMLQVVAITLEDDRINASEKEALLERTFGSPRPRTPKPLRRERNDNANKNANENNAGPRPLMLSKKDAEGQFPTVPFTKFSGPSLDGEEISTDDYLGTKVLLIDFWATWCGPCIREMPDLVKLHEEYGEKGLKILGVSLDNPEAAEKIRSAMERMKMTWPQIYDGGGWKAGPARLNNVRSIPHTILLDENGVARFAGLRGTSLETAVRRMIEEESVLNAKANPEQTKYDTLILDLGVNERAHLLMWRSNDEGLEKLAAYREKYPDSKNLEQVMYLQAIGLWNLYRYSKAAEAYEEYLEHFPEEKRSSLSMTRRVQSLIRSDQPDAALVAIDEYSDGPASDQRSIHSADALALAGRSADARAFLKTWIDMVELPSGADRMKDMAREQYDRLGWIGKPPLAFEVPSEDGGNPLTPDTFQGDVLLIDFWAAWCKPCMAQMPHLVELYKKYNDKGFEILGVSLDSDRTRMKDAAAKVGATWPMFFDGEKWDNELVQKFDVHRIPFMILVDRKGNVRAIDPPKAALDRLIGECIKEQ